LNTHILIISHLKKPEYGRENDLPTIYRLKDSSALYQDPSNVILIHRKRKSVEFLTPGEEVFEHNGTVLVAKNRDFGTTGIARFTLNKDLHSFDF
jgi:replicative DNA helicase